VHNIQQKTKNKKRQRAFSQHNDQAQEDEAQEQIKFIIRVTIYRKLN
jgi:hypothetical protein